ncbi:class I SAM-dependent methyltransferase [Pararhodonellum marinum]|uniref:class I SAM-dependent methyltransferase n=1 Tax=Pararhodonellum marinum TaxID=2755358 RepID=UPI00293BCFEE|nr:RsmD family RNA methyltransferase [Pararhodonellum marinum]
MSELGTIYTEELVKFVQDHLEEDPALLLLKYGGKTSFDLKFAIQQISARQKSRHKIPSWAAHKQLLFPNSLSMEQASSEATAIYKSQFVQGDHLLDLTGGFGIDAYFLSRNFQKAIYVERDKELCQIALHNFEMLIPGKIEVVHAEAGEFIEKTPFNFDLIYLDPARRGKFNQKLYKLEDCEPNVVSLWQQLMLKSKMVMIKTSPIIDLKSAIRLLPDIQQVWVIALGNEVKEVVLIWKKGGNVPVPSISCINLKSGEETLFTFDFEEEEALEIPYTPASNYLIEPNAAILKAGAFKAFAQRYALGKLHPNTHLYTSSSQPKNLQGRIFKIKQEIKNPSKELKKLIPKGLVNVISRNHPLDASAFKKQYKLRDGGEDYLIACKGPNGNQVFWCERLG